MPKRGDIVNVDGDVAIYVAETTSVDGDGNQVSGAIVHILGLPTVVPAASVTELNAGASEPPAVEEPTPPETTSPPVMQVG